LDLVGKLTYLPLLTGLGCPFDCPYCATSSLQSRQESRLPGDVLEDIRHWNREHGIEDFAFYDDALLADAERTIKPVLQGVCLEGLSVRFHTPNAMHVRFLTKEMCRLLYQSGFTTLRLGLETTQTESQRELGGKVDTEQFLEAVENLTAAGFSNSQIGVYLMCGLPGQAPDDVAASVRMVSQAGAQPHLSEYSPIPGTRTFEEVPAAQKRMLQAEPLTHNNSYFACRRPDFSYDDMVALKRMTRLARRTDHVV
jgi:radical SAM superfamily enzyme YgiQ (UPF0313 family)